jgi:hypothetical protein
MIFLPPVQFDFASTVNWGQYTAKLQKCKRISAIVHIPFLNRTVLFQFKRYDTRKTQALCA